VLKRRQTPAAHRISSDYVDGRRVAHFSREIAAQCEVNTREADKYESKKVTIRGIARPIFLAILLSAMIAAVAGTPVSGPISRPMAANAALGPAPTGVRSGGPQSGTPANQSGAEAAQSLDRAAGSASTQGILTYGIGAYKLSQIYLSYTFEIPSPTFSGAPGFEDGLATKYFTGLTNGQPMWSTNESDAVPVVSDVVQGAND
jgi:hypothetical protein